MSKNGMWGGLSNRNFQMSLSHLPDPKQLYTIDFSRLDGGLNLYDLDYQLNPNESPDMKNLRWKDGALGCRYGQDWVIEAVEADTDRGYAAYEGLFPDEDESTGYAFVHVGTELRCFKPSAATPTYTVIQTGLADAAVRRGTFFRYGEYLMYKYATGYYKIAYDPTGQTVAAKFPVTSAKDPGAAYVPVTYINTDPTTHAGTAYQPENRLSRQMTMWYTAEENVRIYNLPYGDTEKHITQVVKVTVNGVEYTPDNEDQNKRYTATIDDANQTANVTFNVAPPVSFPVEANTVRITYAVNDPDSHLESYNAIMNCKYATVYGGDQNLCVVLGGYPAQPNAYFWNGNTDVGMDPFYFPMDHYNLAGDYENQIMGFGKQQGFLVIFSKKGVGRAKFGTTTTTSDRLAIELPYTAINSRIGCDFPWSIQLVDNNLVFVNQEHGVCLLSDSSAAYENNIVEISKKICGNDKRNGLLYDLAVAATGNKAWVSKVYSTVFEDKYWVVANGHAYVWDFRLSTYTNPSWFYYTNIPAVAFIHYVEELWHMNKDGAISKFVPGVFADYGGAIEKVYQFATQMMGTYDRLKNVVSVIFATRSDTNTMADVMYITDYEDRYDLTPIRAYSWKLAPLNLTYYYLGVQRFAVVSRRNPMCRHVRHFAMRLENNEAYQDLSVISAQMQYNYQGRQK